MHYIEDMVYMDPTQHIDKACLASKYFYSRLKYIFGPIFFVKFF